MFRNRINSLSCGCAMEVYSLACLCYGVHALNGVDLDVAMDDITGWISQTVGD